jgi:hypothetical protein
MERYDLKHYRRYKLMAVHIIECSGCSLDGYWNIYCNVTKITVGIHFPSVCPPTSSEGLELRDGVVLLTTDVESCNGWNPLSLK